MKVGAVLLAAGLGRRFGGDKLRHPVEGVPLFTRAMAAVPAALFARAAVVARDGDILHAAELAGYLPVRNDAPALGVSHSLRLGLAQMDGMDAVLFTVCDQPWLTVESVRRLLDAHAASPEAITALSWEGKRGNPVLFPGKFFPALMALIGDVGGSAVIARYPEAVRLVPAGNAAELDDMDTQEKEESPMLMKNGDPVPHVLAAALDGDAYGLTVFSQMRPSCQKRYAGYIMEGKTEESVQKRVAWTMREIYKYGEKHGI